MKNHKYMLAMLLSSSLLVGCQGDFKGGKTKCDK